MVDIITAAHEARPDAGKGLDAGSITGGDKAAFNNFSNLVINDMKAAQNYVASTFGTPSIVDDRSNVGGASKETGAALGDQEFHNISDAAAKGGTITLNGHKIDFGDGKMPPTTKGSDGPTIPDWPTGTPGQPIDITDLRGGKDKNPNIPPDAGDTASPTIDPKTLDRGHAAPPTIDPRTLDHDHTALPPCDPRTIDRDHTSPHRIPHSDDPADVRKTHIIWE